jgi:hypothetical protein
MSVEGANPAGIGKPKTLGSFAAKIGHLRIKICSPLFIEPIVDFGRFASQAFAAHCMWRNLKARSLEIEIFLLCAPTELQASAGREPEAVVFDTTIQTARAAR